MKRVVTILILTICACAGSASEPKRALSDRLQINVVNSSDTSTALPGISVYIIDKHGGVKELGTTDKFGDITITKSALHEALVIIFHHKYFFSGALRVTEDDLLHYDERLLALAPIVVR